ncbi:MAG TPA: nucleoside recognition domain-containing protein [Chthoniobacteraceae bacterium]|jgi:spore maturation protein SpmA|nr:nucleoside recognition domain-containing protein [Chthoniobacteraceae bacterium]
MLNWIWLCFVVVAVLVAGFTGRLEAMNNGAMAAAKDAVMVIALPLMGIWAVWLGVMRLAEQSGLVQLLARALRPIMRRLFPDVPPDHPAMGAMVLNMAANMIGIGNAATPLGLRAMAHLERLNPNPGVASNAMCTFLAISTASIQLVPTSAISILAVKGSTSAHAIWPTAFLASLCATAAGITAAKVLQRLPIFRIPPAGIAPTTATDRPAPAAAEQLVEAETVQPAALRPWGKVIIGLFITVFVIFLVMLAFRDAVAGWLEPHGFVIPAAPKLLVGKPPVLRVLFSMATLAIPFMLSFFPLYAALRGVRVYEQFVEGAKEAFGTAQRVIPYLVAMLVSIAMLREAGVFDMLQAWLGPLFKSLHFPADLLPMVLIRPMSGSATTGIFVELVQRFGPDSLIARTAATIYGSTETTFYVIAIYFGSVAVRQTRHAIAAGLAADITAVIASVFLCRLFFPA